MDHERWIEAVASKKHMPEADVRMDHTGAPGANREYINMDHFTDLDKKQQTILLSQIDLYEAELFFERLLTM